VAGAGRGVPEFEPEIGSPLEPAILLCIVTNVRAKRDVAALDEMMGCVCLALRRAARALTQSYDHVLRAHHLRITQLPILVAASRHDAVPLAQLAERLGMDRTTLLRNVRPLVKRRLIDAGPAPGSRRTEIRITPSGRALLARAYPDWKRAQVRVLESLGGTDWSRKLAALGDALRSAR
jgi:DNA-binding MarR family transcriptional regulator